MSGPGQVTMCDYCLVFTLEKMNETNSLTYREHEGCCPEVTCYNISEQCFECWKIAALYILQELRHFAYFPGFQLIEYTLQVSISETQHDLSGVSKRKHMEKVYLSMFSSKTLNFYSRYPTLVENINKPDMLLQIKSTFNP